MIVRTSPARQSHAVIAGAARSLRQRAVAAASNPADCPPGKRSVFDSWRFSERPGIFSTRPAALVEFK
jgi:hypothetical protein